MPLTNVFSSSALNATCPASLSAGRPKENGSKSLVLLSTMRVNV
jgi:hypothetical protein